MNVVGNEFNVNMQGLTGLDLHNIQAAGGIIKNTDDLGEYLLDGVVNFSPRIIIRIDDKAKAEATLRAMGIIE